VRNELDRLHGKGLRYIFPIHLLNNKFGGTPIANLMLDISSMYLNGEPLYVEPAEQSDQISFWLPSDFDISSMIKDHKDELMAGAFGLPIVLPLLPTLTDVFGVTPLGGGAAMGAGLLPIALLGAVGALPGALQAIPPSVWPIDHHYPPYPGKAPGEAPW